MGLVIDRASCHKNDEGLDCSHFPDVKEALKKTANRLAWPGEKCAVTLGQKQIFYGDFNET